MWERHVEFDRDVAPAHGRRVLAVAHRVGVAFPDLDKRGRRPADDVGCRAGAADAEDHARERGFCTAARTPCPRRARTPRAPPAVLDDALPAQAHQQGGDQSADADQKRQGEEQAHHEGPLAQPRRHTR